MDIKVDLLPWTDHTIKPTQRTAASHSSRPTSLIFTRECSFSSDPPETDHHWCDGSPELTTIYMYIHQAMGQVPSGLAWIHIYSLFNCKYLAKWSVCQLSEKILYVMKGRSHTRPFECHVQTKQAATVKLRKHVCHRKRERHSAVTLFRNQNTNAICMSVWCTLVKWIFKRKVKPIKCFSADYTKWRPPQVKTLLLHPNPAIGCSCWCIVYCIVYCAALLVH